MTEARIRATGPDWSRETGLLIAQLRKQLGWSYDDMQNALMEATRDDRFGVVKPSITTLRHIEEGFYDPEGNHRTRRLEAGEIRAFAKAFGMRTDDLLQMRS